MAEYGVIYNKLLYKKESFHIYNNPFQRGWCVCNKAQCMELLFKEI